MYKSVLIELIGGVHVYYDLHVIFFFFFTILSRHGRLLVFIFIFPDERRVYPAKATGGSRPARAEEARRRTDIVHPENSKERSGARDYQRRYLK